MAGLAVCVLGVVRCARPELARGPVEMSVAEDSVAEGEGGDRTVTEPMEVRTTGLHVPYAMPTFRNAAGEPLRHRVYSVPGFRRTFPDLQDVQIVAARRWGVSPVEDRKEAERRKDELVYVGSNPYYIMDKGMTHSIPYLVPRASDLLQKIGRNFLDSLAIKDIIESAFDISTTTLPASRIHAKGGTLERKVADGYEVLEIPKGSWVEAIFAKKREPMEKLRFVPEQEYDEDGNRRIPDEEVDEDTETEEEEDVTNDETFYDSYTPEADIKDVDEEMADE